MSTGAVAPPDGARAWFPIADPDGWRAAAAADPLAYWARCVEGAVWRRRPQRVFDGSLRAPRWFADGLLNATESCLDRHAATHPDAVAYDAVREDGAAARSVTYAQLLAEVNRLAGALRADGVRRGDRVGIYVPNSVEAVVAMLACARIGAIHCVVFAGMGIDALASRLRDVGAVALIAGDCTLRRGRTIPLLATVRGAVAASPDVRRVVLWRRLARGPLGAGEVDWDAYVAGAPPACEPEILESGAPLFVLHTSGTTGAPKGIVHVHGGFIAGAPSVFAAMTGLTPDDVLLVTSDVGWMTGHLQMVYGALANRYRSIIREGAPDHPDLSATYALIEQHRITQIYTTPTYARMLMRGGAARARAHDLSSLRAIYSGGEPLNPPVWRFLFDDLGRGRVAVCQHWGQTETGAPSLGFLPTEPVVPEATGRPMGALAFDVVDERGEPAAPGQHGAFVMRAPWPHMFVGVWNDERRHARSFERFPGCYETGDVARRVDGDLFAVSGRGDDVINVAGHKVAPATVESALLTHAACVDAACVGVPDEIRGEAIKAFVVVRDGSPADEGVRAALLATVRERAGPIAVPRDLDFVTSIPKTRSGKVMRRLLRARELGTDPGDLTTVEE